VSGGGYPIAGRDAGLAGGHAVTVAAMESTSTYREGALYCLEEVMTAWLLNAAQITRRAMQPPAEPDHPSAGVGP
jgi:hypothetical protein